MKEVSTLILKFSKVYNMPEKSEVVVLARE